jgi:hypothetical protein
MKNASKTLIISAFTIASFSSCVKQMDALAVVAPASSRVEKFAGMKANENFEWSTSPKIKFNFLGRVGREYETVLKVQDIDGNTVFQNCRNEMKILKMYLKYLTMANRY